MLVEARIGRRQSQIKHFPSKVRYPVVVAKLYFRNTSTMITCTECQTS